MTLDAGNPVGAHAAASGGDAKAVARDEEENGLIARCLAGDAESFRPLVQRYQRLVFSVALRMLGGRAEAEDVSQQAFVDAYDALDRFRGEGRSHAFSTWLVRIAVNRAKDVLNPSAGPRSRWTARWAVGRRRSPTPRPIPRSRPCVVKTSAGSRWRWRASPSSIARC